MSKNNSRHSLSRFFGKRLQFVGIIEKKRIYKTKINICITSVVPIINEDYVINHVWVTLSSNSLSDIKVGELVNFVGTVTKYKRRPKFGPNGFLSTTDYGLKKVTKIVKATNLPSTMKNNSMITSQTTIKDLTKEEQDEIKRRNKALYYRKYRARKKAEFKQKEQKVEELSDQVDFLVRENQRLKGELFDARYSRIAR